MYNGPLVTTSCVLHASIGELHSNLLSISVGPKTEMKVLPFRVFLNIPFRWTAA